MFYAAVSAFCFKRVSSKANLVKTDLLKPSKWEKLSKLKTNVTVTGRSTGHVATCWRSLNEETKKEEKIYEPETKSLGCEIKTRRI